MPNTRFLSHFCSLMWLCDTVTPWGQEHTLTGDNSFLSHLFLPLWMECVPHPIPMLKHKPQCHVISGKTLGGN